VPLGETASAAPIWAVKDDFSKIYGFEIVIVIDLWLNTRLSMGGKGFSILQLTTVTHLHGMARTAQRHGGAEPCDTSAYNNHLKRHYHDSGITVFPARLSSVPKPYLLCLPIRKASLGVGVFLRRLSSV
jgi:hypothetical protein